MQVPILSIPKHYYLNPERTDVVPDQVVYFNAYNMELVPYEGCLIDVEGADYPHPVFPPPEGLLAVNVLKDTVRSYLENPVLFLNPTKLSNQFLRLFDKVFYGFKVHPMYFSKASYNFYRFTYRFLQLFIHSHLADQVAYALAHIIEYDDAYKLRLIDIMSEYQFGNPRRAFLRLVEVYTLREKLGVYQKTVKLVKPLSWFLLLPKVQNVFNENEILIEGMQYTNQDKYWVAFKAESDYKFRGMSKDERMKVVKNAPMMYELSS